MSANNASARVEYCRWRNDSIATAALVGASIANFVGFATGYGAGQLVGVIAWVVILWGCCYSLNAYSLLVVDLSSFLAAMCQAGTVVFIYYNCDTAGLPVDLCDDTTGHVIRGSVACMFWFATFSIMLNFPIDAKPTKGNAASHVTTGHLVRRDKTSLMIDRNELRKSGVPEKEIDETIDEGTTNSTQPESNPAKQSRLEMSCEVRNPKTSRTIRETHNTPPRHRLSKRSSKHSSKETREETIACGGDVEQGLDLSAPTNRKNKHVHVKKSEGAMDRVDKETARGCATRIKNDTKVSKAHHVGNSDSGSRLTSQVDREKSKNVSMEATANASTESPKKKTKKTESGKIKTGNEERVGNSDSGSKLTSQFDREKSKRKATKATANVSTTAPRTTTEKSKSGKTKTGNVEHIGNSDPGMSLTSRLDKKSKSTTTEAIANAGTKSSGKKIEKTKSGKKKSSGKNSSEKTKTKKTKSGKVDKVEAEKDTDSHISF